MNPKEGLKALARNPWVQRGVLLTTLLSANALAACTRPEEEPSMPVTTPVPRAGEAKPQPVQIVPKESAEEGWKHFRSVTYPYEIDYPNSWTPNYIELFGGNRVDAFLGGVFQGFQTNLTVFAEPIKPWVTPEDYKNKVVIEKSQAFRVQWGIKEGEVMSHKSNELIDGQEAWIILESMPLDDDRYLFLTAAFTKGSEGWQITVSSKDATAQLVFYDALSSFKFLSGK